MERIGSHKCAYQFTSHQLCVWDQQPNVRISCKKKTRCCRFKVTRKVSGTHTNAIYIVFRRTALVTEMLPSFGMVRIHRERRASSTGS